MGGAEEARAWRDMNKGGGARGGGVICVAKHNNKSVLLLAKEKRGDDEYSLDGRCWGDKEAEYVPHGGGGPVVEQEDGGQHERDKVRQNLQTNEKRKTRRKMETRGWLRAET
jgi:hypothetical protein